MDIRTLATVGRFKEIVVTLFNYGFDDLVDRLEIPGAGVLKRFRKTRPSLSTYERIRLTLEELGPTFIKFGQIMSQRPDLLPKALIFELRKLQDEVPPESFETIRSVVEDSVKGPLESVFSDFEEQPVAAASLSQVHRAVLRKTGETVAVKVQRSGIEPKIKKDLDILAAIVKRLHERIEEVAVYDLPSLVQVTSRTLMRELDFTREAQYMRIARSMLSEDTAVHVPEVYGEATTRKMLVMEFVEGERLRDLDPRTLAEPERLAKEGLRLTIKEVLEYGFFHADPHPGNLIIRHDGVLCILDWGMVGRLTDGDRYELIELISAVTERDSKRLVDALLLITQAQSGVNRRALERELLDILDSYAAVPIGEINMGSALLDITAVLREFRIRVPSDLAVMIKALVTSEGTARQIYPDLDVFSEAEEQVKLLATKRFRPKAVWRGIRNLFFHLVSLRENLPARMASIVEKVERGDLSIRFEHENLGGLRRTMENVSNRLTFGVIIGAMIIGSSMIITTGVEPLLFGLPALGLIGYLISGILGLWLIFNIIRTRRY